MFNCQFIPECREYLPELEKARKQRAKTLQEVKDDSMNRLLKDLAIDRTKNPHGPLHDRWDPEEEEEDDDTEINIIDRSKCSSREMNNGDAESATGEERYPGEYIDVTRARRHEVENISWPRPA